MDFRFRGWQTNARGCMFFQLHMPRHRYRSLALQMDAHRAVKRPDLAIAIAGSTNVTRTIKTNKNKENKKIDSYRIRAYMSYRSMNLIEFNSSFDWEIYGIKGGRKKVASVESTWVIHVARATTHLTHLEESAVSRGHCAWLTLSQRHSWQLFTCTTTIHTHTHRTRRLRISYCRYVTPVSFLSALRALNSKLARKKEKRRQKKNKYVWSVSVFWQARSACVFVMSSERMHRTGPDGTRYSFEWPRHPTG